MVVKWSVRPSIADAALVEQPDDGVVVVAANPADDFVGGEIAPAAAVFGEIG